MTEQVNKQTKQESKQTKTKTKRERERKRITHNLLPTSYDYGERNTNTVSKNMFFRKKSKQKTKG